MNDPEKIVHQYQKFLSVLEKVLLPENFKAFEKISEDIGERLAIAPRGLTEQTGGKPGALIDFSIATASAAKKISGHYDIDVKSAIKVALLHELGKVGCAQQDLFLPQDSDWHREKLGQNYKYNPESRKMTVAHRTLSLLSKYKISLTTDEFIALQTSQGLHLEENRFYGSELQFNPLVCILQSARSIVFSSNT